MIPYLGCHDAQEMLQAFVDGELQMAEQVAVESHLRWCRVCAARVEDLQIIGASLRLTSCAMRAADAPDDRLASVQSEVLTRISTEREQSLASQLRDMCVDMRFFWAAMGATVALFACFCVAGAVLSITSPENPDSLAGMKDTEEGIGVLTRAIQIDPGEKPTRAGIRQHFCFHLPVRAP